MVRSTHHDLTSEFQRHLEILDSLKNYFDASSHVSKNEFIIVNAATLEKHSGIQALEWIKRVNRSNVASLSAPSLRAGRYEDLILQEFKTSRD